MAFKNIDRDKETGFKTSVLLDAPFRGKDFSICFLSNEKDAPKGRELGMHVLMKADLAAIKTNKKECKRLSKKFDCFLASVSMIKEIPPTLRKNLARRDKFPKSVIKSDDLEREVEEARKRVSIVLKVKSKCSLNIGFAVGKMSQSDEELSGNVGKVLNQIVSQTKKKWSNIQGVVLKRTMGNPVRVV